MQSSKKIVVVHNDLNKRGGGEAVCLAVCEALESQHDVTLLLASSSSDIDDVFDYFNTRLEETTIKTVQVGGFELGRFLRLAGKLTPGKLEYFSDRIRGALFNRFMSKSLPKCDLFVCTWNELAAPQPGIHYIHYPIQHKLVEPRATDSRLLKILTSVVDNVLLTFSRYDPDLIKKDTVIVNSEWTEKQVKEKYNINPIVCHPPIDTNNLQNHTPWEQREKGFVFLSRISPEKNILWLIDIIAELRGRGYELHFHIVGPKDPDNPEYYDTVQKKSNEYSFIHMEGELWGEELAQLLCTHRFGINGAMPEQFGMAIAEMVAAGMIPFVPNSGGQTKVVSENGSLMFKTTEEAVNKIERVMMDDDHRIAVRSTLPNIEARYGKSAFKNKIKQVVSAALNE